MKMHVEKINVAPTRSIKGSSQKLL